MKLTLCLLLALLLCCNLCEAGSKKIPLAAVVGQERYDQAKLPLVCVTVGLKGINLQLDSLFLQDVQSRKSYKVDMAKACTLAGKPKYPVRTDEQGRCLSLAVLALPPGTYRVESVHYQAGPAEEDGIVQLSAPGAAPFHFVVSAGKVNYVGSIVFHADWNTAARQAFNDEKNNSVRSEGSFDGGFEVVNTAEADRQWVSRVIPALAPLPSQLAPIGGKPQL